MKGGFMQSIDYLSETRNIIDEIDNEIIELLNKRFELMPEIARFKTENHLPIFQSEREQEILENKIVQAKELGLSETFVRNLFELIFEESKRLQEVAIGVIRH